MHFRMRIISFLLIGMISGSVILAAGLSKEEQAWVAKASREERNGWVFLHIEGKPFVRGFQHGYLLAKEIAESLRVEKYMDWWSTGKEWPYFVEQTLKMFAPNIDPEFQEEMEGIAAGAGKAGVDVKYGDIVMLNALFEIMGYWYPASLKDGSQPQRTGGCSAFIATGKATSDGRIVMAHNTWAHFVSTRLNVIIDLMPEKGFRMMMQAFPAAIHSGTDFFVCSSGLVGSETTINYFKGFRPEGIPEFVRIRKAMQYARSLDEALKIMIDGNNGGYANTWLFGDIRSNEIARLELGLKCHSIERTRDGFYSGSNITENIPLLRQETEDDLDNIKHSGIARRVRWLELFDKWTGKIDAECGKVMLADHYDVYAGKEQPGDRTICGHLELAPDPAGNPGDAWVKPFYPAGALDGKVVDAQMAREMSFWAKWGSSCDIPFDARKFLQEHRQYDYLKGYLKSRPAEPWTVFKSASK